MARRVLKKINTKLNLLLRQSNYLNIRLEDYSVMHILTMDTRHGQSPESKALKTKLQIAQNKCICFCLGLPPCGHTSSSHFRKIKWLPAERRVELCTSATVNTGKEWHHTVEMKKFCFK